MSLFGVWKKELEKRPFRNSFLLTLPFVIGIVSILPAYFTYLENRQGFVMYDPVLSLFAPVDVSIFTFSITYLAGMLGLYYSLQEPSTFLRVAQTYVLMMSMRLICLYVVTLNPPASIIPLKDVFLSTFFYSGKEYNNDLFFSGHTATIFVFALCATHKKWKWYFAISALLIGAGVLIQHVHYTIDVIAAPVFAWMAWKTSSTIQQRWPLA